MRRTIVILLASVGCAHPAPSWVLGGPVPLLDSSVVALGEPLPESASGRPWTTIVSATGKDSARLYRLQGSGTQGVGAVRAELAPTGVVAALYFEVGPGLPYKAVAARFRKQYGPATAACEDDACLTWIASGYHIALARRADPEVTRISMTSGASVKWWPPGYTTPPRPTWSARDRACQLGMLDLCPRPSSEPWF